MTPSQVKLSERMQINRGRSRSGTLGKNRLKLQTWPAWMASRSLPLATSYANPFFFSRVVMRNMLLPARWKAAFLHS